MPICVSQTERKFKRVDGRLVGDAEVIRYDQASINGVDQLHPIAFDRNGNPIPGVVFTFQSLTPGLDIFVERSIYWGQNLEGSTGEVATKSLSTQWYFGEGSRDFFNNYFLVYNPNQTGGYARFTFFLENGTTVHRELMVGPQQRITLDASSVPELAAQNFGVQLHATVPVVAERAMYFGLGPAGFIGGTASAGAPGLSPLWMFAEGPWLRARSRFHLWRESC